MPELKVSAGCLKGYCQKIQDFLGKISRRLSLRWRIYLSLTAILVPVFAVTIFIQTKLTRPLLEEEARQIGTSVCRSLSTEIAAFHLLTKPDRLEARLIETNWLQPSIVRLDVFVREGNAVRLFASNIADPESEESDLTPELINSLLEGSPKAELRKDQNRRYWEIIYPIKDQRRTLGYLHAEVSLSIVRQVVATFSKISLLGDLAALALLMGLLSYYLRRMIENERRLRKAESENLDLTAQLHETQRQLFLNEKLAIMGQLTASFAHEIGTPLNSLSGHLQLLQGEIEAEGPRSRIGIINSQVNRIEGIVKEFLASTYTPPQQRQLVEVRSLIECITKLVAVRTNALRTTVQVKVAPNVEPIRVVPTDLEQVLLNLTNNAMDALEHTPNAKELVYEARRIQEQNKSILQISVIDNGEGISPSALKQALKPFFTTKAPGQGTGLGLTISQRLVKKYGGRLELESELGKGTTVKVSIPYDTP